jgi:hypothetical protein
MAKIVAHAAAGDVAAAHQEDPARKSSRHEP